MDIYNAEESRKLDHINRKPKKKNNKTLVTLINKSYIMKNTIEELNYTQYKKYLDNCNRKYVESKDRETPFEETITICSTPGFKRRSFYVNDGEQTFKDEGLYAERELRRLDYFGFLDYLNYLNVKYDEIRGQSYFEGFHIEVKPISKSIKPRNFYCSRFTQTFKNPCDWYGDD